MLCYEAKKKKECECLHVIFYPTILDDYHIQFILQSEVEGYRDEMDIDLALQEAQSLGIEV